MDSKMYKTPNEAELLALMDRTGYQMIQENGQRKYGPPPDWIGKPPPRGCEIFVGKIPRNCYENELVPAFEKIGKIYEFRLMMDFSGCNRGYCFVMYTNKEDAKRAIQEMNNYEIRKGHFLGVCASVDNCRLFVGGIPKDKQKHEIMAEIEKVTDGVVDVIVYADVSDKTKNRGFAFVEYASHRDAAMARRKLVPGKIKLFGNPIAVDWAEPEKEVAEDVMSRVKVLYVRNLMLGTTEETLRNVFNMAVGRRDAVERIKKIKDYAFIHFTDRHDAEKALATINGNYLEGSMVEVMFAKPIDKESYIRYTKNIGGHHPSSTNKNQDKCLITEQLKQLSVHENKQNAFNNSGASGALFMPNTLVGARPSNPGMLYNANFSGFPQPQLKSILPLPLFPTTPAISPHPLIPFHPGQVTSIANQSPMAYVYNASSAVENNPYLQSSLSLKMDASQFGKHFPSGFKAMDEGRLKSRQMDGQGGLSIRDHGGGDNPGGFRSS